MFSPRRLPQPSPHRLGHPHVPRRRGLSLPEALISLAICSSLLAAMGVAFQAMSRTMTANDEFATAAQTARAAIARLEREIRRGVLDNSIVTDGSGMTSTIRLISAETTNATADRSYTFDSNNKILWMVTNAIPNDANLALATNVSNAKFLITRGTDANGNQCISQVGITMTVTVKKNSITLSGSASPRKALAN